ncbi:Uncharacterised protein [Streptococcus pneumoniae]|nr:Uncharacterised protein [Streptococcus pneumoniae]
MYTSVLPLQMKSYMFHVNVVIYFLTLHQVGLFLPLDLSTSQECIYVYLLFLSGYALTVLLSLVTIHVVHDESELTLKFDYDHMLSSQSYS